MTVIRGIYEEIMADLIAKGFGGYVQRLDHDYQHSTESQSIRTSEITQKTKNESSTPISTYKNERAAVGQTAAHLPIEVVS